MNMIETEMEFKKALTPILKHAIFEHKNFALIQDMIDGLIASTPEYQLLDPDFIDLEISNKDLPEDIVFRLEYFLTNGDKEEIEIEKNERS